MPGPMRNAETASPSDDDRLRSAAEEFAHFDEIQVLLKNKESTRSLARLSALLRQAFSTVWISARGDFVAASLLVFLNAGLATVQVILAGRLLTTLLAQGSHVRIRPLVPDVVAVAIAAAASLAAAAATQQVQRVLGQKVIRHTSRQMLDVTTTVPLEAYETPWFFNFVIRIQTNGLTKPLELAQAIVNIVAGTTTFVAVGAVLLTIEPLLLPLLILTALPAYFANRVGSRWDFHFAVESAPAIRERAYYDTILKLRDAAKEVRAYDLAPLMRKRWEDRYREYLTGLRAVVRRRLVLTVGSGLLTAALTTGTMIFLLWRVSTGNVALAQAGAALIGLRLMTSRLQTTSAGANGLFECRLFLEDLNNFLSLREAFSGAQPAGEGARTPASHHAAPRRFSQLDVERVSYRYPGSETLALRDVSLELTAGQVVALVGENGSGKTTLAKLLAGLHQPTGGIIRWDGVATTAMDPRELRRNVAVIFQDFQRYELSAMENIGIGRAHDELDADSVVEAAVNAGANDFLRTLPNGYETPLSKARPGGADLSLGQWQRVALARAFYRGADFVILDEPTSALDPRAEHDLFAHIRELLHGRSVLLISHRFSSVLAADRIYVLDAGRIIESGTHRELMHKRGRYHELFSLQAAAYRSAEL
jgi:ATP-binding cassette subfamily B protein